MSFTDSTAEPFLVAENFTVPPPQRKRCKAFNPLHTTSAPVCVVTASETLTTQIQFPARAMLAVVRIFPGQADIDCICSSELQNIRSVPTCTDIGGLFCLPATTDWSLRKLRNYLPINGGAYGITVEKLASHHAIRLLIGLFGRSLCYVVFHSVGTRFISRCTVLGSGNSTRRFAERLASWRELVRAAALHGRVRKDLEWVQDPLPLRR